MGWVNPSRTPTLLDTQRQHKTFMSSLLTSRQKNYCLKFLVTRIIIEIDP